MIPWKGKGLRGDAPHCLVDGLMTTAIQQPLLNPNSLDRCAGIAKHSSCHGQTLLQEPTAPIIALQYAHCPMEHLLSYKHHLQTRATQKRLLPETRLSIQETADNHYFSAHFHQGWKEAMKWCWAVGHSEMGDEIQPGSFTGHTFHYFLSCSLFPQSLGEGKEGF